MNSDPTSENPLRALLQERIAAALVAGADGPAWDGIPVRPDPAEPAPLSAGQARLWLQCQADDRQAATYHVPLVLRLVGALDADALRQAVRGVIERHRVLRSVIRESAAGEVLVPVEADAVPVNTVDAAGENLAELLEREAAQPFDLRREPPTRATLLRLEPELHVLVLIFHHIAVDDVSLGLVQDEIAEAYSSAVTGMPSPGGLAPQVPQYADYSAWSAEPEQNRRVDDQLDWWAGRLAGLASELPLPSDRPRSAAADFAGDSVPITISAGLSDQIRTVSRVLNMTPYMVFLAGWQLLLARLAGVTDVAVGVPYSGRSHPDTEKMIGFFVNSLVLRTAVDGTQTGRELLEQVRDTVLDVYANAEVPFQRVVERLQPERSLGVNPLFQTVVNLLESGRPRASFAGLSAEALSSRGLTALFDLSLDLVESAEGYAGELSFRTARFESAEAARWARWFTRTLEGLLSGLDSPIEQIDLATAADQAEVLALGVGPDLAEPVPTVPEAIAGHERRRPDALAVTGPAGSLTFAEQAAWSTRLASELAAIGVVPGDRVGVCVPRDQYLPATLLGVWKAGAAYVPLDPELPALRLNWMIGHAGVDVVVAYGNTLAVADAAGSSQVLDAGDLPDLPANFQPHVSRPEDLAYVLYTSGSTGTPKGVAVAHGSLGALAAAMQSTPGVGDQDSMLAVAPLAFDASCLEIWVPLAAGARCVLVERAVAVDGHALAEVLSAGAVTVAHVVPTALRGVLSTGWAGAPDLRLWTGSESLDPDLARQVRERVGELWNFYGPTEATVISTAHKVRERDDAIVPIGRPLPGERLYVLGDDGQPALRGTAGELWLGGAGVSTGYWDNPSATEAAFAPDPFGPDGSRRYRTGDIVRWRGDGTLEFLGRRDHQVKIRGHRIELGEVESAILTHPEVVHAVVTVHGSGTQAQLIGYLVPRSEDASVPAIEAHVRDRLPSYMVPLRWIVIPAIPTLPSGKIDRAALPAPTEAGPRRGIPVETDVELLVSEMWQAVLDLKEVFADDDFFQLGGHSFAATQVTGWLRDSLEIDVPVRLLFEHPRLSAFALRVEQQLSADRPPDAHIQAPSPTTPLNQEYGNE